MTPHHPCAGPHYPIPKSTPREWWDDALLDLGQPRISHVHALPRKASDDERTWVTPPPVDALRQQRSWCTCVVSGSPEGRCPQRAAGRRSVVAGLLRFGTQGPQRNAVVRQWS